MLRKLFLRYKYKWYMTLAYLASHMDGQPDFEEHESTANEAERLLCVESIQ